jgi:hypothetical protein
VAATSVVAATAAGATIAGDALPSARSSSPSSPASTVAAPRAAAVRAEEPQRLPGLAPADWLVVGDALDPADPQQQQLLENMLRAIGVGLVAPTRERRAVYVAVDATPIATAIAAVAPRCVLALGKAAAGGAARCRRAARWAARPRPRPRRRRRRRHVRARVPAPPSGGKGEGVGRSLSGGRRAQRLTFTGRFQPRSVVCRARAIVSSPAGAAFAIVEPPPIVAPAPISTGATRTQLLPMCASAPIVVRCLLAPS